MIRVMIRVCILIETSIIFDTTKPDGTPRKLMDVQLLTGLGWKANVGLRDGLNFSYKDFLANHKD